LNLIEKQQCFAGRNVLSSQQPEFRQHALRILLEKRAVQIPFTLQIHRHDQLKMFRPPALDQVRFSDLSRPTQNQGFPA